MPLLFVVIIVVFVNFSSSVLAQETTTRLRGPRSTDVAPAPQTLGPLTPSDTLWRVAERVRPAPDISLYQVMYALYLKNPDAFLEQNLNHLRPGAVLQLPTASEIRQIDLNLARQKSEQDDARWAMRQIDLNLARQKVATEQPAAADTANQTVKKLPPAQWQAELERLGQQQRQDLDTLRSQFADSMQLLETMAGENLQLKTSLARLQHELELLKAQLGEDSDIQQQLQLLLQQQQQLLRDKAAEEAVKHSAPDWSAWLTHPLAWILAACIPALLVLFGVLLWVRKRSRHTEQVVNAATTEPVVSPLYQSPLPPLDDNNDVDESLFEIDDALLEDAFGDASSHSPQELQDDLLEFDDALSLDNDDSLLPADDALEPSVAADTLPQDEFDPENILSDDDLSALLAAADDDDDVIELADESLLQEPDEPELSEMAAADMLAQTDTETALSAVDDVADFDIDELIEEIDLDQPDSLLPDEPTQAEQLSAALSQPVAVKPADSDDDFARITEDITARTVPAGAEAGQGSPDRSELDDFAESLAGEMLSDAEVEHLVAEDDVVSGRGSLADDETLLSAELSAELSDLLEQADAFMPPPAAAGIPPEDAALAEVEAPADVSAALLPDDDILLLDDIAADIDDKTLAALDLTASDDETVVRPTEAALSVENPSKMLEQYPELELTDDELLAELPPDILLDELNDFADAAEADGTPEDDTPELELDPIPDAQFDSLMSELEAMADNLEQAEQEPHAGLQPAQDDIPAVAEQQAELAHNFVDEDFVEIDSLLASAGAQQEDSERFSHLNVDVGLEDYAGIIGEHERRDVDTEDNGYSAKLDLVRAYIEIDDMESAELLLDEILASDAPEHVKTEAQRLKA